MARKVSVGNRARVASAKNVDAASELGEPEELDQKISAAKGWLEKLGKSPRDALALFRALANDVDRGCRNFDFSTVQWSTRQVWAAFELMCLCGLREAQSSRSPASNRAVVTLALWYADAIEQQRDQIVAEMLPDYRRGKRVREKGKEPHRSWASRYRQAEQFRKIALELRQPRSQNARHRDISRRYYGDDSHYKTVQRRMKEFPVPLHIFELALGRKLD
jgi:hypothetical protein